MKNLLLLPFLLFGLFAYAQDDMYAKSYQAPEKKIKTSCGQTIIESYDKMTGHTAYHLEKPTKLNKGSNALNTILSRQNGTVYFNISASNNRPCIKEGELISILFTDGTLLKMDNIAAGNCKGIVVLAFSEENQNTQDLELFKTKEVEAIRIYTDENYIQTELNEKNRKDLQQSFQCILSV